MKILKSEDADSTQVAFEVIVHSGNVCTQVYEVLKMGEQGQFDQVQDLLAQAEEEIRVAHQTQTDLIQSEARGEDVKLTLLWPHAQDTLMIAMSELQMARHILQLYKRIHALEG